MTHASATAAKIQPARIEPPQGRLSTWDLIKTSLDNPLETWPAAIYQEPWYAPAPRPLQPPTLFAMDPDAIRDVTLAKQAAFDKGPITNRKLRPVLGDGLLTAEGDHWKWQHRAAASIFRRDRIDGFVPMMTGAAENAVDRWRRAGDGARVDLNVDMMRATLEAVLATLVSAEERARLDGVVEAASEYLDTLGGITVADLLGLPHWLRRAAAPRGAAAVRHIRRSVAEIIARRRARAATSDDLVARLMEARDPVTGRAMDDGELLDNILTFIAAGHETTAVTLMWSLYLLSLDDRAAARVRDEAARVAGDAPIDGAHVRELTYTRQVVYEAMRLYPPVGAISRSALEDVEIGGREITAGTQVILPIYAIHRHARLWDDPHAFDPDRFAPELGMEKRKFQYLPFGAGVRVCIGAAFGLIEATAMLATFARAAAFTPVAGHDLRPVLKISLRPDGGMPMTLRLRDAARADDRVAA